MEVCPTSTHNQQHLFPAVLLRHTLPDASAHWDLLVAGSEPGLWAARLMQAVVWQSDTHFEAQPIQRHREHYLSYEGPVQGGALGSVVRVRAGVGSVVQALRGSLETTTLTLWWEGDTCPRQWIATHADSPLLRFASLPRAHAPD
jgi:hypothetical protein